ncbi:MAG TPA: hypothetical protein VMB73_33670 [Acetobacteraceae bacterium]|jgi:hypothetical protein|nr:hypothetical protein [Acetobacteraceae bacterium]
MPDENVRLVHVSGECEIDFARRELRVLGSPVLIGGRAFEIIEVLARSAGTGLYDRFTQGFETPDLRAAKAFLDELPG